MASIGFPRERKWEGKSGATYNYHQTNYITINNLVHPSAGGQPFAKGDPFESYREQVPTPSNASYSTAFPTFSRNYSEDVFSAKMNAKRPASFKPIGDIHASHKNIVKLVPVNQENLGELGLKKADQYFSEVAGYMMIVLTIAIFIGILFWSVLSKFVNPSDSNAILSFFHDDSYYCWLIPLVLPVTTVIIYCNWLSMKYFRHS